MSTLDSIVQVVITRETRGIASANFSDVLFLTKTATSRVKSYSTAKEVADDGYAANSAEYLAALAFFNQNAHPQKFLIGQWDELAPETITDALNAIIDENNAWYGLVVDDISTSADIVSAATWAKANKKFLFTSTADTVVVDSTEASDVTSIAYLLNDGAQNKTNLLYNTATRGAAGTTADYPDVSFASNILAKVIGSYTAEYKTITGASTDELTTTQIGNAEDKNTSYYISLYGRDIIRGSRVTDGNTPKNGEWLDIEIGLDWLEVRIQEEVFLAIINAEKVPYTDKGTLILSSAVEEVLERAVSQGLVASYTVAVEPVSQQSTTDRANRVYNGISFEAVLAGAIHTTTINGIVRV